MSRQTTNYGLTKPDYTDTADIEVINSNMDIVDNTLKVIDTKAMNVMSKNSSAWSSTTTYTVGQYCIYNNSLWKCLVQHSGQTPQEGTYWTKVSLDTLGAEISAINSNLINYSQKFKTGMITATTNENGYIATNIPLNSKFVCSATTNGNGYACIPVRVSGDVWWFYVFGTSNGYVSPSINMSFQVNYYYYDL